MSDRIAHCVPEPGAAEQVTDLTDEIAKAEQNPAAVVRPLCRARPCPYRQLRSDIGARGFRSRRAHQAPIPSVQHRVLYRARRRASAAGGTHDALADYDAALGAKPEDVRRKRMSTRCAAISTPTRARRSLAVADFSRLIAAEARLCRCLLAEGGLLRKPQGLCERACRLRPAGEAAARRLDRLVADLLGARLLEQRPPRRFARLRYRPAPEPGRPEHPGRPGVRQSSPWPIRRGHRRLRRGAAARSRDLPGSLYLRGVAKLRLGDGAGAKLDFAAAERLEPEVAGRFSGYGIVPP